MTQRDLATAPVSAGIARTSYTIPSDEIVGDYTLHGTYQENTHYKQATDTADFKVRIATTITVDNAIGNKGQTATFTAHVKYDNTIAVTEGQVQIKLDGTIIGTGNVSNGTATVSYLIPSNYNGEGVITANYLGTNTYGASATTTSGTLSTRKEGTILCPVHRGNRDETVQISAIFQYGGQSVSPSNLEPFDFYIDDVKIGTGTAVTVGYRLQYTIPSNMAAGTHTLKVIMPENDEYEECEVTTTLTVRMPTHIVAEAVSANAGGTVTLTANVYDENNAIVPSGQATFKQGGNDITDGTVSVGTSGTATKTINIPANASEGSTLTYTVEYLQNDNYMSCSPVSITVTIRKTPVIVVNDVTANRGDVIQLVASAQYNNENITEGSITFSITENT